MSRYSLDKKGMLSNSAYGAPLYDGYGHLPFIYSCVVREQNIANVVTILNLNNVYLLEYK